MNRFSQRCLNVAPRIVALSAVLSGAVFLSVTSAAHARPPGGLQPTFVACDEEPGASQPWEGSTETGTNTGNGNKLTSIPLFGWTARGGLPVSLELHNNSQSDVVTELGAKWTHSFDIYMVFDPATQAATIHWGDALAYPFTKTANGYAAPTGIYDTITSTGTASAPTSFTLTTKAGVKYQFNAHTNNRWRCASITDRNGNALTLTHNSGDYVTAVTDPTGRAITFTYDAQNKITQVSDPMGRQYNLSYDASGRLSQVAYPTVGSTTPTVGFGYDGSNRLASVTDPRGNATTFGYNSNASLAWEKNALLQQTTYTYTANYTQIKDARNFVVKHNYASGKLASIVDELGNTTSFSYDANNNKTGVTNALGKLTAYTFDARGNVLTTTDPLSHTTAFTYNALNLPLTVTTAGNRTSTLTYDANGNKLTEANPLGETNTYTYGSFGLVASAKNALNQTATFSYDQNGYVASVTDPLIHSKSYTYDAMGHKLTESAGAYTTSYSYDALGRLTDTTAPGSRVTSIAYDAAGNKTSVTNAIGQVNTFVYNAISQVTSHTDALNRTVSYAYDATGNKTTYTDGRGKVTTYAYSGRGELTGITYADGTSDAWTYNAIGKQLTKTDGRGIATTLSYDDAARLVGKSFSGSSAASVSFAYDVDNRKTGMTDGTGSTSYTYDDAGRLLTRTSPQGSITYTYDAAGRKASQTSGSVSTSYAYDNAGRLTGATTNLQVTAYAYDSLNRLTSTTNPNGVVETKAYDSSTNDLLEIWAKNGTTTVSRQNYAYDGLGRKSVETTANGAVKSYTYDAAGQLTNETRSGTDGYVINYTYDNAGNRLTKLLTPYGGGRAATENYTYDDANKLLTAGAKAYTYDAAGNAKIVTTGAAVTTLNWDGAGRMSGIIYPNASTNTFTYNGLDQRVGKVDSAGTASYTLADDAIDSNVLADGAATYQFGLGLSSEVRGGATRYYHADALGTTRATSDAAGATNSTLETDAFGNTWQAGTTGTQTPFGFAGQHGYQTDADSGLQRLGYRYYDASTGRFLSRDPIQDGRNWYIYCSNDPIQKVDPRGLGENDGSVHNGSNQTQWAVGTSPDIRHWVKGDPTIPGLPNPTHVYDPPKGPSIPGWDTHSPGGYIMFPVKPGQTIGGGGLDIDGGYDSWHDRWDKTGGHATGNWTWSGDFTGGWYNPFPPPLGPGPIPIDPYLTPTEIIYGPPYIPIEVIYIR